MTKCTDMLLKKMRKAIAVQNFSQFLIFLAKASHIFEQEILEYFRYKRLKF